MRSIQDILNSRSDISPFLVHLTRQHSALSAKKILTKIIEDGQLISSNHAISDASFGMYTNNLTAKERRRLFGAVSFTETPLTEVHCLLDVANRQVDLEPFGLVFLKERLSKKGVSPVLYINNEAGD